MMKFGNLLCAVAFTLLLTACDNFVGGVVINNGKPVQLINHSSGEQVIVAPHASGQTEFRFTYSIGGEYNVGIMDDQGQECTIDNNQAWYQGFPVFNVKVSCPDAQGDFWSGNPIVRDIYGADPAVLVDGEYLYLYVGRDETSNYHTVFYRCGKDCFKERLQRMGNFDITGIYAYRTKDMVNWESLGPVLKAKDVSWMKQTWASQVVKKDNTYYLYTSSPSALFVGVVGDVITQSVLGLFLGRGGDKGPHGSVGVAVSQSPTGPFRDVGYPLISPLTPGASITTIDPSVFIEEDGSAYIFWGGKGELRYAKLSDNMLSLDGPVMVPEGEYPGFEEGPYLHKKDERYYLTYSASKNPTPGPLRYAVADSIHGPWEAKGDYLGDVGLVTNHGAVTEFKGKDYAFYHKGNIPGVTEGGLLPFLLPNVATRTTNVDVLEYDEEGQIKRVIQTSRGVKQNNN
jgi:arabinoxylan arabinofuranohydrolase